MARVARRGKDGPEPVGNHYKELVTSRMTQGVIHAFEVIKIDKEESIEPLSGRYREQSFCLVSKMHTVGKRGDRIEQRHAVHLLHIRADL